MQLRTRQAGLTIFSHRNVVVMPGSSIFPQSCPNKSKGLLKYSQVAVDVQIPKMSRQFRMFDESTQCCSDSSVAISDENFTKSVKFEATRTGQNLPVTEVTKCEEWLFDELKNPVATLLPV